MSCCPTSTPSSCCTPAQQCYPENFGLDFPSLVGPMGPPGGPGTFVENYAALRVIDASVFTQGYVAWVSGYAATNDGGGGNFAYDAVSVAADNDGTILAPANGIGRWLRIYNGPVSPEWFGATGDGVTDDSAAIIAAYTLLAASGGIVQFGVGSFKFSSALTPGASISFSGVGMAKSEVSDSPAQPTRLIKDGNFTGITLLRASSLENLILDGAAANGGDGVQILGANCWFTNVSVFRQGSRGIVVGDQVGSLDTNWCNFSNVVARLNGSHGWFINNSVATNSNGCVFDGCRAWENTGNGFRLGVTRYNSFTGCYAEGNIDKGWKILANADRNNFWGCSAEPIGAQHVVFDAGSVNNVWFGGGALDVTDIIDNGDNCVMLPHGGEGTKDRKGLYIRGQVRAGNDPQDLEGLTTEHGMLASGTTPGYGYYTENGTDSAHRIWEQFTDVNTMYLKICNFAGTVKTALWSILRSGATSASMTFSNVCSVRFDFPPKLPVGTYAEIVALAPAGGLNNGCLAIMTDLNSAVPGAVAAAGGANRCAVWCDGTAANYRILS